MRKDLEKAHKEKKPITFEQKFGDQTYQFKGFLTGKTQSRYFGRKEYLVDKIEVIMPRWITEEKLQTLQDRINKLLK